MYEERMEESQSLFDNMFESQSQKTDRTLVLEEKAGTTKWLAPKQRCRAASMTYFEWLRQIHSLVRRVGAAAVSNAWKVTGIFDMRRLHS